jgi:arsenate reductase
MIQVYHNPRCTKSRECMLFLEESGQPYEIIKYLEDMPTVEELKTIIKKLGIKPIELVRQKEPLWIEKFKGKKMTDNAIIKAIVANPILMERPIIINGDKAVIARPLEKAADIL